MIEVNNKVDFADAEVITHEPIEEYEELVVNYQPPSPVDVRLPSGSSVLGGYERGLMLGRPGESKTFYIDGGDWLKALVKSIIS